MSELEVGKVGWLVLMVALYGIRHLRITLTLLDILETRRALMLYQYLCCVGTPDSAHSFDETQLRNTHSRMQRIRTWIHCGSTTVFMI